MSAFVEREAKRLAADPEALRRFQEFGTADWPVEIQAEVLAEIEARKQRGRMHAVGESQPFVTLTAKEICDLPDPPPTDRIAGSILVRGYRLVIGADTGHGKSSFVNALLKTVTEGGDFLGFESKGGAKALVIDTEQAVQSIKRKLRAAGLADSESVVFHCVPDGLELDTSAKQRGEIEQIISGGFDVVVFDPLYKLHAGDSNDERASVDLAKILDSWRAKYEFALILTTHIRKRSSGPKARFSIHDLFGSGAWVRGAEVVLGLEIVADGRSRLHFFKDRDGDLPAPGTRWELLFDRENGYRRNPDDGGSDPTTGASFRPTTLMERVSRFVEANPGATQRAIRASVTGKTDWTLIGLDILVAEGYITRTQSGQSQLHESVKPYRECEDRSPGSQPVPNRSPEPVGAGGSLVPPLKGDQEPPELPHEDEWFPDAEGVDDGLPF